MSVCLHINRLLIFSDFKQSWNRRDTIPWKLFNVKFHETLFTVFVICGQTYIGGVIRYILKFFVSNAPKKWSKAGRDPYEQDYRTIE